MDERVQALTSSSNVSATVQDTESLVAIRLDKARFPRYRDIPPSERQKWIAREFRLLATIARVRDIDKNDALIVATSLDERVIGEPRLSDLTLPEMDYAFKEGVFGKYGDYYGLGAVSMYSFLESYYGSEKKAEATRAVREAREKEIRDEDEAYRAKIRAEIEEAKRNGSFVPTGRFDFGRVFKRVEDEEESSREDHRAKIHQQAQDIRSGKLKF